MKKFLRFILFVIIIAVAYFTSDYLIEQNSVYLEMKQSEQHNENIIKNQDEIVELDDINEDNDSLSGNQNIGEENLNETYLSGDVSFSGESVEVIETENISDNEAQILSGDVQYSDEEIIDNQENEGVSEENKVIFN